MRKMLGKYLSLPVYKKCYRKHTKLSERIKFVKMNLQALKEKFYSRNCYRLCQIFGLYGVG